MWNIDFISEKDFKTHVEKTINSYGDNLFSYNIKILNSNIIDPVKMIFDKYVYHKSLEDLIGGEIFRQRDKSNNNAIGYFHQKIFSYIDNCRVPENGQDGGWDVIYDSPKPLVLPEGDKVSRIYVEMKNKHNTMNSASAARTYIKMQHQLLQNDDCACFLVEVIAKQSQNIKWETSIDKQKVSHKRIRRVSIDKFYSMVTGDDLAFYKICSALPEVINKVISEEKKVKAPVDTAYNELIKIADNLNQGSQDLSLAMAIYLLGFSSYEGFKDYNLSLDDLYRYAREARTSG